VKKTFLFSVLVSAFLFSSCDEKEKKETLYYPIDSLVAAQSKFLTDAKAILTKHAEINGEEETSQFTPKDTTAWQHELDIFSELKTINKPINMGAYTVESGVKDTNSNLTITSFTSRKKLPVAYLNVFYLDTPSKLRRIEALYKEDNSLLNGSRLLIMEFQEIENKIVLISYSIEGGQKMFLGDAVQFSVKGTVTLP
jgi:hypothetical protein